MRNLLTLLMLLAGGCISDAPVSQMVTVRDGGVSEQDARSSNLDLSIGDGMFRPPATDARPMDALRLVPDAIRDVAMQDRPEAGTVSDGGAEADADASASSPDSAVDAGGRPVEERPVSELVFAGTHNSYSGGSRRSIIAQLDRGVRVIELDFHVEDFDERRDWLVGHVRPGHEVGFGAGNPDTSLLSDWLQVVTTWSDMHRGHAPIFIILDSKSWLSQIDAPEDGSLGALNRRLLDILGDRLYPARAWDGPWPTLAELRGRIVVILSGNGADRQAYQRDQGSDPAVAMNGHGRVVEIHSAADRGLWSWTGQLQPDGRVFWWHHRRYDTGTQPAVVIRDDGVVFDLHRTHGPMNKLWSAVGRLRADYTIEWSAAQRVGNGSRPSLRLLNDGRVQAVFTDGRHRKAMIGELDDDGEAIEWEESEETDEEPFDVRRSGRIEVDTRADDFAPNDTIQYRVDQGEFRRIVYAQLMVTEFQNGDSREIQRSARVFGTQAGRGSDDFTAAWSRQGLVRVWGFDRERTGDMPVPQIPATDTPFEAWYNDLMIDVNAVDWRPE